nr:hypothetical protein [uncultured Allomuricauda sp.]
MGKELSPELIAKLPKDVDPCGENGELHTFSFDGPKFIKKRIYSLLRKT